MATARTHAARARLLGALLVAVLALTAACGPPRSAASFCTTFEEETRELRAKYTDRAGSLDPEGEPFMSLLLGLGSLVEAQGDIVTMFRQLEAVAPEEIHADVTTIRSSLEDQLDAAGDAVGDPLGGFGSSLVAGLSAMGSYTAFEQYVTSNCDLSSIDES